jgi:cyclic beta-1,2-glucan synthetase
MADDIVGARRLRRIADEVADGLLGVGGSLPTDAMTTLERLAKNKLPQPFAVQLIRRLRDQDPETTPGLPWLLERLASEGTHAEAIVEQTQHRQVATNLTVRNIVTSLRHISSFDWAEFVERASLVDRALVEGSAYAEMSFSTRDRYRHAIEDLSKGSGTSELEVAEATLRLAAAETDDRRQHDPGYYLLGEGRRQIEAEIGYRPDPGLVSSRFARRHAATVYLSSITAVTAVVLAVPILLTDRASPWRWLMACLALIPATDVAIAVVNRAVAALAQPQELPSLALPQGPTQDLRTLVAIPAMLTRTEQIEALVERLEVHHLADPDGEFHYALLTDWRDAEEPELPDDADLLAAALSGIDRLNTRHGPAPGGGDRFVLLHRSRIFNPSEGRYMGWERKRGKLHELNRLMRGAADTSYLPWHGRLPDRVRYVIALDQDSRLPPGAATKLVATMAHPLNRARVDAPLGRVVAGYGVLQPRVTAFLGAGGSSFFQRVFFPPAGIDPYAAAVSDVYQDLFGEGSFAGKGIYEIDTFEASLDGRIPENTLLSHDLFEGSFARAGLITTVEVFEEFPSHYEVALARQHRWVRGDWQLLPWILGRRGPLPPVARIKMVDNLRRSLAPLAALLTLVASFLLPATAVWTWTALIATSMTFPALLPLFERMIPRRTTTPGAVRLRRWWGDAGRVGGRFILQAAFLAHQAVRTTEAIIVTLWRLYVSHTHMLEWVTAEESERRFGLDQTAFVRRMAPSMAVGLFTAGAAAAVKPHAFIAALAWAWLWVAAPLFAHWASIPRVVQVSDPATPEESEELRLSARRTWRYFERFVTEEDNWLPPDNYQEDVSAVAHRTSPTNIGLYLLAVLTAREFRWIGIDETIARLDSTLSTLDEMERFEGHFLNWYDTVSLEPLLPRYVSTVDSGNMAGHLLAVSEGCRRLAHRGPERGISAGIRDCALLIRTAAQRLPLGGVADFVSPRDLDSALATLLALLDHSDEDGHEHLAQIEQAAETVADIARTLKSGRDGDELGYWADALATTLHGQRGDNQLFDDPERRHLMRVRFDALADRTARLANDMDFSFLMNPENKLLSIGYRVADAALDDSHYDFLASEARLASFVGIAKGDLPPSHWFRLGRSMSPMGTDPALISWSGSMFEYLMPLLVMRSPPESVLNATYRAVVERQIEYGKERQVPWGISEAAYAARDVHLTYQYRAFGVPGLGFERGLSEDLVIAPYATMLAAMVQPRQAIANLQRLSRMGALGVYGYYEALDFTPARRPEGEQAVVVQTYMAHHQAMSIVAAANVLFDGVARRLFHGEPSVQAAELLLHERVPRDVEVARPRAEEVAESARPLVEAKGVVRRVETPHSPVPVAHHLSNGRFSTVVTAAGRAWRSTGGGKTRHATATAPTCSSRTKRVERGRRATSRPGLSQTSTTPHSARTRSRSRDEMERSPPP